MIRPNTPLKLTAAGFSHATLGETNERDLSRIPGVVIEAGDAKFFVQNFSGGLTPEKMSNLAHSAISLIAHLPDHLRRLAKRLAVNGVAVNGVRHHSVPILFIPSCATHLPLKSEP